MQVRGCLAVFLLDPSETGRLVGAPDGVYEALGILVLEEHLGNTSRLGMTLTVLSGLESYYFIEGPWRTALRWEYWWELPLYSGGLDRGWAEVAALRQAVEDPACSLQGLRPLHEAFRSSLALRVDEFLLMEGARGRWRVDEGGHASFFVDAMWQLGTEPDGRWLSVCRQSHVAKAGSLVGALTVDVVPCIVCRELLRPSDRRKS
jgi:hypothetical protein